MTVNEKDLSGNEKRAANCTLTYDHNGTYTDCGKPELWECYLEKCRENRILEDILVPSF